MEGEDRTETAARNPPVQVRGLINSSFEDQRTFIRP